ncbi:hypothetical protein [Thalassorhabdomicrobium marinisediminis]|uniref:hypothetical protein n=1 Tax=Thalassorhabdomicrobium marinisediminis TaxID=2170577 RepID=UPI002493CB78|nr:hypothetical protein [Thalassorhabdomicrobium marinisediminis]
MRRRFFLLSAPLALTACGGVARREVLAPQADIDRVAYVHPGPKRLTLMTMKNTGSDNGAHSGLIINASQQVLWDPAGTFGHDTIPERNDVHFGITPQLAELYISFHSRETYYTLIQEVDVSAEVAEQALQLAIANGPTPKAMCTAHTSRMLAQLPGFEHIRPTFFPNNLADQFAQTPGVRTRIHRENDADDKSIAAAEIDAVLRAAQ